MLLHGILEVATQIPELKMTEPEAEKIGILSANVLRHYDVSRQSQKAIDIVALIGGLGVIYGSRAITYRMRMVEKRRQPSPTVSPVLRTAS